MQFGDPLESRLVSRKNSTATRLQHQPTSTSTFTYNKPDHYRDAMESDDAPLWSVAEDREISSLIKFLNLLDQESNMDNRETSPESLFHQKQKTFKFQPEYG